MDAAPSASSASTNTPVAQATPDSPKTTGEVKETTTAIQDDAAPQLSAKKYKVKVDGEELEVDESELLTGYQTRKAADKKFREAAQYRKQAEEFISMLKADPVKVLSHPSIGHDMRKLAEEYLVSQLQEEALSPEQRELKEAKRKLQEYEEQEKRKKQEEEQTQLEKLQSHYAEEYTNKITQALEASTLPKTPMTIKRMAYYLHRGLEMGIPVDVKDAAELVKQDYIEEQKNLFGALDEDTLVTLLDKGVLDKIRKAELKKAKAVQPTQGQKFVGEGLKEPRTPKKMSKDDWKSNLEKIKRGEI